MKVEVAVLGSPSLIGLVVSAGVKQHLKKKKKKKYLSYQLHPSKRRVHFLHVQLECFPPSGTLLSALPCPYGVL